MIEVELKEAGKISRLTNRTFQFDSKLGEGFYSANYFIKAQKIVAENAPGHTVTMQWFQRRDDSMLCGVDEAIALVHTFAKHPEDLKIEALHDGDIIQAMEPVLKITGKYENFGFLESVIDGILARRTSVATNVHEVLKVANGVPVFSMADRQDDYHTQVGDGYATYVAGIKKVSTDAQGAWWGGRGMGTMPHALIQVCGGDVCKASDIYLKSFPNEKITALIDYHNHVVRDSLILARYLGTKLNAVRIDTSKSLIDHYFDDKDTSGFDAYGVCKELVFALREALDKNGFNFVKIIVSSSFTAEKIKEWSHLNVPVDMYGVGTSFVNNMTCGFTGDLVVLDGKPEAKEGRANYQNTHLEEVKYPIY
ncbi:MAG TPA: nicotinate phosphoribosyltransferase [Bacilli bacterium]|jgi:nicotinate phosphoribosyltransferase|nr:nicotinate phosphoribosyltransferase [Bacilli bacterium]HPY79591.1 nicotinate phosphoribosyltransferase [Bacilli bacterium]HQA55934.1 nicotinate phosphoribosyltransferase [Bacilli bacterium]